MLVKDFVNAQVPPRKAPVCLFAFQRWLFPGFCGLGSFPIALYLSRRNGALVCVQTFPKGSVGGGGVWEGEGKVFNALLWLKRARLGSQSVAPEKENEPTEDKPEA